MPNVNVFSMAQCDKIKLFVRIIVAIVVASCLYTFTTCDAIAEAMKISIMTTCFKFKKRENADVPTIQLASLFLCFDVASSWIHHSQKCYQLRHSSPVIRNAIHVFLFFNTRNKVKLIYQPLIGKHKAGRRRRRRWHYTLLLISNPGHSAIPPVHHRISSNQQPNTITLQIRYTLQYISCCSIRTVRWILRSCLLYISTAWAKD